MRNFNVILRNDFNAYYTLNQTVPITINNNPAQNVGDCSVTYNGTDYIGECRVNDDVSNDLFFYRMSDAVTGDFSSIALHEEMTLDRNGNPRRTKTLGQMII